MSNPLPESISKAQCDAALEALGIEWRGLGLQSLEINPHDVVVRRLVKRDDRSIVGESTVRIPIDRRRVPDDVSLSDDPAEPFSDDTTHYTTEGYHLASQCAGYPECPEAKL